MGMSGQIYSSAAWRQEEGLSEPSEEETGRTPEPIWTLS